MLGLGHRVSLATLIALCALSFAQAGEAVEPLDDGTSTVVNQARIALSATAARTVLVLGSAGLVGTALTKELQSHGYTVLEVKSRLDIDLRSKGSLDVFNNQTIGFCFFLASEWGSPKRPATGGALGVGKCAAEPLPQDTRERVHWGDQYIAPLQDNFRWLVDTARS